jgi:hypothetical protein
MMEKVDGRPEGLGASSVTIGVMLARNPQGTPYGFSSEANLDAAEKRPKTLRNLVRPAF